MTVGVLNPNETDLKRIVFVINQLAQGRNNSTGSVTLTASATSTDVTAINCASGSVPVLVPTTAHASADFGAGTIYVSAVDNGSFTITHGSNTDTDRTFLWACLG